MKNVSESDRSMVEMLGVLAVIGVLSVGAIAGYRRAMDSQKASATIAELNQYAFLASQQALQKRADLDLSELGNVTDQGYPVSAVVQADPTFFEILLAFVKLHLDIGFAFLQIEGCVSSNGSTVMAY